MWLNRKDYSIHNAKYRAYEPHEKTLLKIDSPEVRDTVISENVWNILFLVDETCAKGIIRGKISDLWRRYKLGDIKLVI